MPNVGNGKVIQGFGATAVVLKPPGLFIQWLTEQGTLEIITIIHKLYSKKYTYNNNNNNSTFYAV